MGDGVKKTLNVLFSASDAVGVTGDEPQLPEPPELPDRDEEEARARRLAERRAVRARERLRARAGFEDTILTGPGGLGPVPAVNKKTGNLLGI